MLMLRWALVIASEGYVPEELARYTLSVTTEMAFLVGFSQMVCRASMGGAAAGGRRRAAARAARPGRRDRRRAEPRRAGLRAAAGGPVRHRRCGAASRRRSAASRAWWRPEGDSRRGPRGLREPRPRRDARGPQPRRAARRLPARRPGGLAAACGGRRARRASAAHALHARRGDLRLHRRALGRLDRGLRARAGRRGGSAAAPPPAARRSARAGPAGRARRRSRRRPRTPRWRLPRSLAALVVDADGEQRAGRPAGASARPGGARGARGAVHRARWSRRPGAAGRARGGGARAQGSHSGPAVAWQEAALSFARAREVLRLAARGRHRRRRRRCSWPSATSSSLLLGADRRLARDVADVGPRPARRPRPSSRASGSARRSTPGSGTAAAPRPWRRRSTCIRRRSATGWRACASCSDRGSTTRTAASSSSWPCARGA